MALKNENGQDKETVTNVQQKAGNQNKENNQEQRHTRNCDNEISRLRISSEAFLGLTPAMVTV